MSSTYTQTFTLTHAKHLASKVVADLYQCALIYERPSPDQVAAYQEELAALLADHYVESYEFGFQRNGKRVLSWCYMVGPAGDLQGDSRSGGLARGIDVSDADYFNFLVYSSTWSALSTAQRDRIELVLPVRRTPGLSPLDGDGYWTSERGYVAGGVLVQRRVFRP